MELKRSSNVAKCCETEMEKSLGKSGQGCLFAFPPHHERTYEKVNVETLVFIYTINIKKKVDFFFTPYLLLDLFNTFQLTIPLSIAEISSKSTIDFTHSNFGNHVFAKKQSPIKKSNNQKTQHSYSSIVTFNKEFMENCKITLSKL